MRLVVVGHKLPDMHVTSLCCRVVMSSLAQRQLFGNTVYILFFLLTTESSSSRAGVTLKKKKRHQNVENVDYNNLMLAHCSYLCCMSILYILKAFVTQNHTFDPEVCWICLMSTL